MLTIFYDGNCPMCSTEMNHLKQHDNANLVQIVNIHQPDFNKNHPDINFTHAMKILHGKYRGELLLGLAVTHRAWTLVGKGFWVAPLNWPIIKTISHWIYLAIAKYRHPISAFFAKKFGIKSVGCSNGTCNSRMANKGDKSS